MTETVYARSPDVVWRLGPDRVLVRRIGGVGDAAAAELIGEAALVWIALDEPGTMAEVVVRLSGAKVGTLRRNAIHQLLGGGWLHTRSN